MQQLFVRGSLFPLEPAEFLSLSLSLSFPCSVCLFLPPTRRKLRVGSCCSKKDENVVSAALSFSASWVDSYCRRQWRQCWGQCQTDLDTMDALIGVRDCVRGTVSAQPSAPRGTTHHTPCCDTLDAWVLYEVSSDSWEKLFVSDKIMAQHDCWTFVGSSFTQKQDGRPFFRNGFTSRKDPIPMHGQTWKSSTRHFPFRFCFVP